MDAPPEQGVFALAVRHRAPIMATIVALVRDLTLAEDLFQETMLHIVRSAARYQNDRDFVAWARGVARHVVQQHWRRAKQRPAPARLDAAEALAALVADETEEPPWEEERQALRRCLEGLGERGRRLIALRYGEDLRGPALARASGLSETSVRTTLLRLRQTLRRCIEGRIAAGSAGG